MVTSAKYSLDESQQENEGSANAQPLNTDEDSIEELQEVFNTFDENGDGKISREELQRSMAKLGFKLTERDLMSMMEATDLNKNGFLEFEEFASLHSDINAERKDKYSAEKEQDLWEAFCVFDRNGDGFITVHELQYVFCSLGMGKGMKITDFQRMVEGVDKDGDGQVNFPEFKTMMSIKRNGT